MIPWDEFTESVSEAELLARPEGFDHLHLVGENFATCAVTRRPCWRCWNCALHGAQGVLAAVQTLREMNADNLRKVPADAPTPFIKPRWKPLVITPEGHDRRFYEICALSELKNACAPVTSGSRVHGSSATSTTTCCRQRSSPRSSGNRPCPWRSTRTATSNWKSAYRLLDEQLATVTRPGQGQRAARCHPHRVRAEDHPAGFCGAQYRAGADRPDQSSCCRASRSPNC